MKNSKKYIGILGGSFNPVHCGHIQMARAALSCITELDEVWMVPALQNPLKDKDNYASFFKRCRMVELALPKDEPRIKLFEDEALIAHKANKDFLFTDELLDNLPDNAEYTLIVGSDNVYQFKHWHNWKHILDTYGLVVIERPGHPLDMEVFDVRLIMKHPNVIPVCDMDAVDVSSTEIRRIISKIPYEVIRYIWQSELYGIKDDE